MPRFLKFIIVLSVLVGIGWFSIYAYHEVDKSDNAELRKEVARLKTLDEGHVKQMLNIRQQFKTEIRSKQEALVALFPNEAERINAIFSSASEKTEPTKTEPTKGGH